MLSLTPPISIPDAAFFLQTQYVFQFKIRCIIEHLSFTDQRAIVVELLATELVPDVIMFPSEAIKNIFFKCSSVFSEGSN